jgi:hypothetical protein
MYPRDRSGLKDEDDAVDYTVLASAAVDGVSRAQLMGQAFRSLSVEEKERSLGRLTRAGLASADDERIWRTPAGHAAMEDHRYRRAPRLGRLQAMDRCRPVPRPTVAGSVIGSSGGPLAAGGRSRPQRWAALDEQQMLCSCVGRTSHRGSP